MSARNRPDTVARRVLDACRAAGLTIAAVKVAADGSVEVVTVEGQPPVNPWDRHEPARPASRRQ